MAPVVPGHFLLLHRRSLALERILADTARRVSTHLPRVPPRIDALPESTGEIRAGGADGDVPPRVRARAPPRALRVRSVPRPHGHRCRRLRGLSLEDSIPRALLPAKRSPSVDRPPVDSFALTVLDLQLQAAARRRIGPVDHCAGRGERTEPGVVGVVGLERGSAAAASGRSGSHVGDHLGAVRPEEATETRLVALDAVDAAQNDLGIAVGKCDEEGDGGDGAQLEGEGGGKKGERRRGTALHVCIIHVWRTNSHAVQRTWYSTTMFFSPLFTTPYNVQHYAIQRTYSLHTIQGTAVLCFPLLCSSYLVGSEGEHGAETANRRGRVGRVHELVLVVDQVAAVRVEAELLCKVGRETAGRDQGKEECVEWEEQRAAESV